LHLDLKINDMKDNIKMTLILLPVIVAVGAIPALPWWSFILPVILLGGVASWLRWKVWYFFIGFVTGFVCWTGAFLCFHIAFQAPFSNNDQDLSIWAMLGVSGLIGGLLTGLALYTGKSIIQWEART
jgi:hypothetical protein